MGDVAYWWIPVIIVVGITVVLNTYVGTNTALVFLGTLVAREVAND